MKIFTVFSIISFFILTSCVETIVVGSVVGGGLTAREKSFRDTGKDTVIAVELGGEFIAHGLKNPGNSVDITINEGRVLLTGIVRDESKAVLAQKLAWKFSGVKEVINEIQVSPNKMRIKDFSSAFFDYIITARVEVKLLFARDVSSINYKITTVNKVVYLLGVASDGFEMRRALSTVSRVRGVNKVINHVILKSDSRRRGK